MKAREDRRVGSGRGLVSDGVEAGLWRQYQTIHQCHRTGGIYKPKLALAFFFCTLGNYDVASSVYDMSCLTVLQKTWANMLAAKHQN